MARIFNYFLTTYVFNSEKIPAKVVLGTSPFCIEIADEKWDTHNEPGEIFICEPLGDSTVVSVDVANTRLQIATAPDVALNPKDRVWLHLDPAHMLLFDAQSEKAITN